MRELTEKVVEFTRERDWDQFHSPENLAKSISIEAGELLECFQWNNEYDLDEVKEELADVMNYCILLSHQICVDAKQIILDKMEISAQRHRRREFAHSGCRQGGGVYPHGYCNHIGCKER